MFPWRQQQMTEEISLRCYFYRLFLLLEIPLPAESSKRFDHQRSIYVTRIINKVYKRPESPAITVTWHASAYKVSTIHQAHILFAFVQKCRSSESENHQHSPPSQLLNFWPRLGYAWSILTDCRNTGLPVQSDSLTVVLITSRKWMKNFIWPG